MGLSNDLVIILRTFMLENNARFEVLMEKNSSCREVKLTRQMTPSVQSNKLFHRRSGHCNYKQSRVSKTVVPWVCPSSKKSAYTGHRSTSSVSVVNEVVYIKDVPRV